MTDDELNKLKNRLKHAESLNNTANKIDTIVDKLEIGGKCEEIKFRSWEKADGSGFGMMDPGEEYWGITEISPETLGVSKETFDNWYTQFILKRLLELKDSLLKEYSEL